MIVAQSQPLVPLGLRFGLFRIRLDVVSRIFPAIDGSDMRRVSIEIGSSDTKIFIVRIDPLPQLLTGTPSLCPCLALHADDIGRKPVTVAAAEASTMIRPVALSLLPRRDGLPIIVAKCARYTWHQAGIVEHAQRMIERDPETRIHAANHVIHGRHPRSFSSSWILPREILIYELGDRFCDN